MAHVLWVYHCDVRIQGAALDHWAFMRVLYSKVSKWLEMPSLSLLHEVVHLFSRGVQGWLLDGNIPVLLGSEVDRAKRPADSSGTPDPYMFQPDKADKVGRKRARAEQARRGVETGYMRDAYTDGSYTEEGPGGASLVMECGLVPFTP